MPSLYWIDLNASFPVGGLISSDLYRSVSVPDGQWANMGAFWTDKDLTVLYSIGGDGGTVTPPPTNKLPSYNATSQSWTNVSVQGGDFAGLTRNFASSATASTGGQSLGFLTGGADAVTPTGMVSFDASNVSSPQWRNESYAPGMVSTAMSYVRFGKQGVLVAVGGATDVCQPPNSLFFLPERPVTVLTLVGCRAERHV